MDYIDFADHISYNDFSILSIFPYFKATTTEKFTPLMDIGSEMASQNSVRVVVLTALVWAVSLFALPFGLHIILYSINLATNYLLDPFTNGFVPAMLYGLTAAGAFAGYVTSRLLKRYTGTPALRVLPVALAWAAAMLLSVFIMFMFSRLFMPPESPPLPLGEPEPAQTGLPLYVRELARDFVLSMIPGMIGGLALALEVRRGTRMNRWGIIQITTGWGIGFAVGGLLGSAIMILMPVGDERGWIVQDFFIWLNYALIGLFAGLIGGWMTIRAILSAVRPLEKVFTPLQGSNI